MVHRACPRCHAARAPPGEGTSATRAVASLGEMGEGRARRCVCEPRAGHSASPTNYAPFDVWLPHSLTAAGVTLAR